MKKLKYIPLLFLVAVLLLQACYKDEGNYDYHDINEIVDITFEEEPDTVIKGIPRYSSLTGRLTLTPKFNSTMPGNEANYTYQWHIVRGSDPYLYPISFERNLENTLLAAVSARDMPYTLYFYVSDPATGVAFQKTFEVIVSTQISGGFLVMNDIDGVMRLDMLSYYSGGYHYLNDVLAVQGSTMPALEHPRKIVNTRRALPFGRAYGLFLIGGEHTYRINYDTYAWEESGIEGCFGHYSYVPKKWVTRDLLSGSNAQSSILLYGDDDGKTQVFNYMYFMMAAPWTKPVTNADTLFTIAPHIASNNADGAINLMNGWWVVFDDDAKSFRRVSNTYFMNSYTSFSSMPAGTLVPYVNMNKDLIHLSYLAPYFYAILKDTGSGTYHFLRFNTVFAQDKWMEMPNMDGAQFFTANTLQPNNIYYAKGSKVYAWNCEDGTEYEVLDKGGNEITFFGLYNSDFYVASYNGTEGQVETYAPGSLVGSPLELRLGAADFGETNFGKIVSVVRK